MRQVQSSRRVRSWALGAVALFTLLFVAAACDDADIESVESRDDSFSVSSAPRLVVNGFNGRITVNAGSDGTIRVQATLKKADKIDYKTTQDGDTVSVEAKEKGRSTRSCSASAEDTAGLPLDAAALALMAGPFFALSMRWALRRNALDWVARLRRRRTVPPSDTTWRVD